MALVRLKNISIGLTALLAFSGCDTSAPTAPPTAAGNAAVESRDSIESAEQLAADNPLIAPELEPGAVNSEGQIVLRSPVDTVDTPPASSENIPTEARQAPAPAAEAVETTSSKNQSTLPVEANVVSQAERNQQIAQDWPMPQAVLFVSGQQHGYLEPCGCTGLENQKGGIIRRDSLLTMLRQRGWPVVPVDVGNQVRRIGRQPEIKFQTTVAALQKMGYAASTLGVDDLRLSSVELIQAASSDDLSENAFVETNVSVLDPSFFPESKIVEVGGRKIGIAAVLGSEHQQAIQSDDIEIFEPVKKLSPVVAKLKSESCDTIVLLAHASMEESREIAKAVPGIDLVVTAGGFGEPTLKPEAIEGSEAVMVQVGTKGMYGGIIGLFDDEEYPLRYQKIALTSQFKDSPRMLELFAAYQKRLEETGFEELGATPIAHPTGRKFVGSETCGDCHTTAYEVWEGTPHYHATESIVNPPNDRGSIQRHFDPECVSCHVTGWNPQQYYPYESGYLSLAESEPMLGSGCENCHGPGSQHVAAEYGDIDADNELLEQLREQMVLPLANAREKCLDCHDLDNSPDFHEQGAFEEYWERVKHYGKD